MIVGYARISTVDQNADMQIDALKAAGCERIYLDKASGAKDDRPELAKCLGFLQPGDVLCVWKIDRLGRSMQHLVTTVDSLIKRGVAFKATTLPIDTSTASGKLMFGVLAACAEFERSLIRERVIAGMASAKARGVKFGRPKKVTHPILAQAKTMKGISVREIAKKLGVSKTALYDHL